MSDRGIPSSFRRMHGFGSHTYSFVNAEGVRHWVKFHHVCQQAIGYLTDSEGVNTLVPGPVETPGLVGLAPPGGKQKLLADMASTVPMGRVGRPDESPPP